MIISTHSWFDVQQVGCNKVQIINQGQLVYQNSFNQLNQQLQGHIISVYCNHSVDINQIQLIEGVENVLHATDLPEEKVISRSCLKVNCMNSLNTDQIQQISATIVDLSCQQQWGLYEINIEKKSFDAVFLTLTQPTSDSV